MEEGPPSPKEAITTEETEQKGDDRMEEENTTQKATYKDLFGDSESESESGEEKKNQDDGKEEIDQPEEIVQENELLEQEDKTEEGTGEVEELEETILPHFPPGTSLKYVRLPIFLGIDPHPFDPVMWEPEEEEGPNSTPRTLNPESWIRWRYNSNGEKESNSRWVRWEDGTEHLYVGGEAYDISYQNIQTNHSFLFIRQKGFISSKGQLTQKMAFRPVSLGSKTHVKLSNAIAARHKKERKIKLVTTQEDPEKEKREQEKLIEDRIRLTTSMEKAKSRKRRSYLDGELSAELLEDGMEDQERSDNEEGSIAAIKARYKKGDKRSREEEEESEKRLMKAKTSKRNKYESEEEEVEEEVPEEEEDEEEEIPIKKGRKIVYSSDEN